MKKVELSKNEKLIKNMLDSYNLNWEFDETNRVFTVAMYVNDSFDEFKYLIFVESDSVEIVGAKRLSSVVETEIIRNIKEFCRLVNKDFCKRTVLRFDEELNTIICKVFVDCDDMELSYDVIDRSIVAIGCVFYMFGDGIIDVINGDSPKEVYKRCELKDMRKF